MKITVTLPDGSQREFEQGVSALDVAKDISEGLARNVLSAKVNGEVIDATRPLNEDTSIQLLTFKDKEGKDTLWHSTAHLMAEALEVHYPGIQFWVGPPIRNGFYYDCEFPEGQNITDADMPKIEQTMLELARQQNTFDRKEISKADARAYFEEKGDPYKLDLLESLEDGTITFYTQGNFTDLCRGPHIPHTGFIKAVKLMSIAGAYYKGDEKNKQLTRIYGVSFLKQKDLKEHLALLEEAKKRDHRKLGKEMSLFTFSENVGQGLPLWLPKGAALRDRLEMFMKRAQLRAGYLQVITPHIGSKKLYEISGHWDKYGEDSFQPILTPAEGEMFLLKPMNCPHHCEIYKSEPRSYRDLPLRLAEFGTVYRYEQSGELHGLTRVRGFTQDDAHIFCREDQVKEEFKKVIDLVLMVFNALDFKNYKAQISLPDQENIALPEGDPNRKYIGSIEKWNKAEAAIREAAEEKGLETVVEFNEAAFYGSKLDFMVEDALGRSWQLGTIQVDYNLPERFELDYIGSDNEKHRPVMIHRAPFGSMERFIAVLIEHCGGKFPLWLIPDQFIILPISEKYHEYAEKVLEFLNNSDIRGSIYPRAEKIGRKIRDAEVKKIPYMLIVGEKEAAEGVVSLRKQGEGDLGSMTSIEFAKLVEQQIAEDFEQNNNERND